MKHFIQHIIFSLLSHSFGHISHSLSKLITHSKFINAQCDCYEFRINDNNNNNNTQPNVEMAKLSDRRGNCPMWTHHRTFSNFPIATKSVLFFYERNKIFGMYLNDTTKQKRWAEIRTKSKKAKRINWSWWKCRRKTHDKQTANNWYKIGKMCLCVQWS